MSKKKLAKYITITLLVFALIGVTLYENFSFYEEEEEEEEKVDINNNNDNDTFSLPFENRHITKNQAKCSVSGSSYGDPPCLISCETIIFPDDNDEIYFTLQDAKLKGYKICELALQASKFENKTISRNWLQIPEETSPKIVKLEIKSSDLEFIAPESFKNFPDLATLCLGQLEISQLTKNAFTDLANLTGFAVWDLDLKSVEYGFLSNFPKLQTLTVRVAECDNLDIQLFSNLTGNYTAKKVLEVDFRQNCLENITSDVLNNYPNAVQIYLQNAGIRNFQNESLVNLSRLQKLDIENNKIKKIPENVFRNFFEKNKALAVEINGNELECDCEMKWLQDYLKENKNPLAENFKNVKCNNFPPEVKFLEADMCPSLNLTTGSPNYNSTIAPSSTTMPPETSGTPKNFSTTAATTLNLDSDTETDPPATTLPPTVRDNYTEPPDAPPTTDGDYYLDGDGTDDSLPIEIKCKPQTKISNSRIIRSASYIKLRLPKKKSNDNDLIFTLAPKRQYFNISDYDGTTVNVTFNNQENYSGRSILWLTYEDTTNLKKKNNPIASSCSTNIAKKWYLIQNLQPEKSYLICVFDDIAFNVNLLDCVPHTTQPLVENQAWLTFASKPFAIIIMVVVSVIAFIIGSAMLFFLVRKNPKLIKGSKKVIVVKRQDKQQVMIMPNNYQDLRNKVEDSSDNSDSYSVVSYISAIQPSPMEILAFRLERLKEKNQGELGVKMSKLPLPPLESFSTSSPRTSIKTIISTDTIYEND